MVLRLRRKMIGSVLWVVFSKDSTNEVLEVLDLPDD
jgi:hypothetical protein